MKQNHFIIGISGGSGSGKTSLIRKLRESFGEGEMCVVSQDDYYKSREQQTVDAQGVTNFDKPGCFNDGAFESDLKKLIAGENVERMEYTFNNEKKTPGMILLRPAPIILVEGLFIFHFAEIKALCDLKVFIEAHDALKIKRRILRDQVERNYPLEDVLYRYEYHVMPAYHNYIEPYRADADIIINNHSNFDKGLLVLESFIRWQLQNMESNLPG